MSPGYSTHFLAGFLISFPFYYLDKKDRLKTLVLGAFAGIFPDIDGILRIIQAPENPTLQFFFSHRGFWHSLLLPFIFAFLAAVYLLILYFKRPDISKDHFWTLTAVTLAWLSHLILDFGFTPFPYLTSPVWFIPLSEIAVYSIDQISAFIISVLFGWMLLSYFNPLIYVDPFRNIKTTDIRELQKKEHDRAEVDNYLKVTGLMPFSRQIVKIQLVEHKIVTILVIIAVILGALITIFFSLQ